MTLRSSIVLVSFIALLAGVTTQARAQITITAQDARDFLAPGVYAQQTMTPAAGETPRIQQIIDRIGAGAVYDFSGVAVASSSFDEGEIQARPFGPMVPTDADFADVSDAFGGSPTYDFFGIEDAPGGAADGY